MPNYPVEILWCSNQRAGRGNHWSFPPNVRKQLQHDFAGCRVLHLFGGRATFGTRLDVDSFVRPDVIGDAWLPPFAEDSFDVVILDPPYIHLNAQMKGALLRQAAYIARERVVWFNTFDIAAGSGLTKEHAWLVRCGDNCHVRCLIYFRVLRPKQGPTKKFLRGPAMKYNRWLAQPERLPLVPGPMIL